ncbi:hypothetical protein PG991_010709 [Apiospora marii]|uniref:Uncharacterized protein n=2 Tax=Apiospora marii TaxID=335849 RepID=A0ABR1RC57_9PEZI
MPLDKTKSQLVLVAFPAFIAQLPNPVSPVDGDDNSMRLWNATKFLKLAITRVHECFNETHAVTNLSPDDTQKVEVVIEDVLSLLDDLVDDAILPGRATLGVSISTSR